MTSSALSLIEVSRAFGPVQALADVSVEVPPGVAVAVVGPNGSGKSTLLGVAGLSLLPDFGDIQLAGKSILGCRPWQLPNLGVGRVYQMPSPHPNGLVAERLALARYAHSSAWRRLRPGGAAQAEVPAAFMADLERLGLADQLRAPMASLTYAERRYLDLAAASLAGRSVLLLDEPTAGLSQEERRPVVDTLLRLKAAGVAILLVEHDLNFIRTVADQCVVLEQGCVCCSGSVMDVLASRELKKLYLKRGGAARA